MDEVRFINANALCQHIQDWKTRCQELHRHSVGMYHMMIYEVLCQVLDVINDTPTIDPESLRPTAKWIIVRRMADGAECKCGNCGRKEVFTTFDRHTEHTYCCRCGCKMEAAVGIEVRKNDDDAV
jgi:hypothetical protein